MGTVAAGAATAAARPVAAGKEPGQIEAAVRVDLGFDEVVGFGPDRGDRTGFECFASVLPGVVIERTEFVEQPLDRLRRADSAHDGRTNSRWHGRKVGRKVAGELAICEPACDGRGPQDNAGNGFLRRRKENWPSHDESAVARRLGVGLEFFFLLMSDEPTLDAASAVLPTTATGQTTPRRKGVVDGARLRIDPALLDTPLAAWWQRGGAMAVDLVAIGAFSLLAHGVLGLLTGATLTALGSRRESGAKIWGLLRWGLIGLGVVVMGLSGFLLAGKPLVRSGAFNLAAEKAAPDLAPVAVSPAASSFWI